ncbi:MAG: alternative ribosome rescue aminoacyl-tRNA hydrolase ArfB [Pseudomonadales bacterium]|jgi:ribosome-associated protein
MSSSPLANIPEKEIELSAIRASGPGGQNVNKVSSAIHLRFDVRRSSLSETLKTRVLALTDYRISSDGIIVIKAQRFRSQDKNRSDALSRLNDLLLKANIRQKVRRKHRVSKKAKAKRLDNKKRQGNQKNLRKRVKLDA